jgi:S-adenosylmethionine synthetase
VLFISGGIAACAYPDISLRECVRETGKEVGYLPGNHIDVERYQILDHVCRLKEDPRSWNHYSNDQSIIIGYAGYDARTRFLPPEQFLAWYMREAVIRTLQHGMLRGQGPDGKVLVVMNEEGTAWKLRQLLLTLQQDEESEFADLVQRTERVLRSAYASLRKNDARWCENWENIRVLINPNGPLINGGSDGDNGQTGRKLVMDFYGPRIPIGGGALYGKNLAHIDRLGAAQARHFALDMVREGAKDALIRVCYAPGMDDPLSIDIASDKKPQTDPKAFFRFSNMRECIDLRDLEYDDLALGSFYNIHLSFYE